MAALDDRLAGAFIDNGARHRILGRRLKPFSLWHKFLLFTANSPFFNPGEQITFFDLRTTVGICRLKFPNSRVHRPWLVPLFMVIWFGWSKKRWMNFMIRKRNQFLEYCGDYISRPDYAIVPPRMEGPSRPTPRRCPVPENFAVVADLVGFFHCDPAVAWNTPVGQAYWYQMAAYREKGEDIDYLDIEERRFQESIREVIEMPGRAYAGS